MRIEASPFTPAGAAAAAAAAAAVISTMRWRAAAESAW
jgi:hypothetical protein